GAAEQARSSRSVGARLRPVLTAPGRAPTATLESTTVSEHDTDQAPDILPREAVPPPARTPDDGAREFAVLVGNMLRFELGPISARLTEIELTFGRREAEDRENWAWMKRRIIQLSD